MVVGVRRVVFGRDLDGPAVSDDAFVVALWGVEEVDIGQRDVSTRVP